ncbi:MAG: thioesterase family protein [Acidimicrobiia bacterium]
MLELFDVTARGGDRFVAPGMAKPLHDALFGGQAVAQSLWCAGLTVDAGLLPRSLHAYFERPGSAAEPLLVAGERFDTDDDGALRGVRVTQGEREIFSMRVRYCLTSQAIGDVDGEEGFSAVLSSGIPPAPGPDAVILEPLKNAMANIATTDRFPELVPGYQWRPPQTFWGRTIDRLPDDPMVHACALAYMSDMGSGFSGLGGSPGLEDLPPGGPSLDHAVWFHARVRADEWCWNDLQPIASANARALYRGTITAHTGEVAITLMQEMSMRPNPRFWQTAVPTEPVP